MSAEDRAALVGVLVLLYLAAGAAWSVYWDRERRSDEKYAVREDAARAARLELLTPIWPVPLAVLGAVIAWDYLRGIVRTARAGRE